MRCIRLQTYASHSADDTFNLARQLASAAKPGDVYALIGGLGAGKTVFAQGFARGLGFAGPVLSPTFQIMNMYRGGRLDIFHFDLYRLSGGGVEDAAYDDYFFSNGVCLVEWADRAINILPEHTVTVSIETGTGNCRTLRVAKP